MQCECGFIFPKMRRGSSGRQTINKHRRECPLFWSAVLKEMRRISTMLYSKPVAISLAEWNRYRSPDFPSWDGMKRWGKTWHELQVESGLGVSVRGLGSVAKKGPVAIKKGKGANDKCLWQTMDKIASETRQPLQVDETYQALFSVTGFAVCQDTYQRTGRMILR